MKHAYVIGLGNPGNQYENTRHNIGRVAVRECARLCGVTEWERHAGVGEVSRGFVDHIPVTFILPDLLMNRSGEALTHFGISSDAIGETIVVHDDLDLGLGVVRVAYNRGHGGHRGVASIIDAFSTKAFLRVRIGVVPVGFFGKLKKPKDTDDVATFVLSPFHLSEKRRVQNAIARAADAARAIVQNGHEAAMQVFNTR